ncbi:MAG: SxtJ family membrane protein [Candidatus Omnitrophota bacterium]|nr:SxtJ family membrane protein [Candidatus Omnitrophota bacterium]
MMENVKTKDLRQFGIVLGIILGIIGGIQFLKGHTHVYPWFFGFGITALLLGAALPWLLKPVFIGFTKVAHAIGWFNTRVILILVYYLLLTPIGVVMRLFGKDLLNKKIDKSEKTYWLEREKPVAVKEDLEKQF